MNGEEVTAPEAVLVVRFEGEKVLVDLTRGREVRCYQQPKDEQLHLWWQRLHFFALRGACLEKNARTGPNCAKLTTTRCLNGSVEELSSLNCMTKQYSTTIKYSNN